ncbi:acyl-CoA desaturase, partial [Nocardia salmonicida]
FRTIHKLALPDRFLKRTADDAPETSSERKFAGISLPESLRVDPETGKRFGLRSAMHDAKVALEIKARHEKEVLREAKVALKARARQEKLALREAKRALGERAVHERGVLRDKAARRMARHA